MKKLIAGWTVAAVVLASAGSLAAHHSLAQFDTTAAVTVKGVIVRFEQVNPHTLLFVDQKSADGRTQHWAVEGPGISTLKRMGLDPAFLKIGDAVEACGYTAKETGPKITPIPLMDGELIVTSDGRRQKWSDYGFHKCLAPDYQDLHTK